MKSQNFLGEGVIKRQRSKVGPIKSLKFIGGGGGLVNKCNLPLQTSHHL